MKKMNYYAVQNPWRVPRWLGAILGCAFAVMAIGSGIAIVQLTRPPAPPVVQAPPVKAEPVVASAVAPAPSVKAPVAAAEQAAPVAAPAKKHAAKHQKAHGKKAMKMASAKSAPSGLSASKRATILAKHDSKQKRNEKDALDKLLGL